MTPTPPDKDEVDEIFDIAYKHGVDVGHAREHISTRVTKLHFKQAINRLIAEARLKAYEDVKAHVELDIRMTAPNSGFGRQAKEELKFINDRIATLEQSLKEQG